MGNRRKKMKHPQKIRVRSDSEIAGTIMAYKNLYKQDPYLANLMLLCSELSEYIPVPMEDEKKLPAFIKENMDGLIFQFVRRFKAIDVYALPLESPDSPGNTGSGSGASNEDKMFSPPVAAGWAGGTGRA
jgi:hypothetical protein